MDSSLNGFKCAVVPHDTDYRHRNFFMYVAAALDYGIFHVLDYMIFLGIGYFLMTANSNSKSLIKSGFVVLFACTGLTLIWASVEKFAYPEWTNPLFEKTPQMLMVSGFIEIFATFILLGAVSVVGRLISLGPYVYFRSCRPSIRSC